MSDLHSDRLNVEKELSRLKDFQRRTVDAVFQRMYLDFQPTRRFLVADEVGLGKTLVARGVITRAIDHLWDSVKRIDIVYLCSNSDIARQNVRRLTPQGIAGVSLASRITLLPLAAHDLKSRKVNIIALTPGTSLDLKGNLGLKRERALLLHMLRGHWNLEFSGASRLFAGNASLQQFQVSVRHFEDDEKVDADLCRAFLEAVERVCAAAEEKKQKTLRERIEAAAAAFKAEARPSRDLVVQRAAIVGELRQLLAKSCINALQPDLIILDEFQRFKTLLDGEGPAGEMARQLFEYEDESTKTRVLLLSATPYKMYTVQDEAGGEDHYADFVRTARFLFAEEPVEAANLAGYLHRYRRELFRLGQGNSDGFEEMRAGIEATLRKVMVRTERLALTADRSGMLVELGSIGVDVKADDATAYTDLQRVARLVDHPDTMEYWKAAPWLLNFMEQYKLRHDIQDLIDRDHQPREFVKAVESSERLLLPWADVEAFRKLDPAHGRLRWLIEHTLNTELWQLLWLPPELPYYELGEPFRAVSKHSPTKMLVFSAWRVVPRTIAAILSHEAERRMYIALEGQLRDLTDAPKRLGNLLQITRKKGRVAGLTALALIYPSPWLARTCDPKDIAAEFRRSIGRLPTLDEVLEVAEQRLRPFLERIVQSGEVNPTPDESWYWAAPILLDRLHNAAATEDWFNSDLTKLWSSVGDARELVDEEVEEEPEQNDAEAENDTDISALSELVERARKISRGETPRGTPPRDLIRMLALLGIAGPATVALRALTRVTDSTHLWNPEARNAAAQVGTGFRTLFNQPDSTALIRALARKHARVNDYWQQCLEYSASGCLQAVLDEFAHLLVDEAGVFGKDPDEIHEKVAEYIVLAVGLRRASVGTQEIVVTKGRVQSLSRKMRSRFAMRFGEESTDEAGEKFRADDVRRAFNSPFWPFVLATTSVGQEGLDFHLYCHAVVHWNLPANPVDLEQREGRVHRFKGHAIRKNVAKRHADAWHSGEQGDPWEAAFEQAKNERASYDNDLVPYWVYPLPDGAAIERYVPTYPLSREVERFKLLRESLAIYRMVFGQPRQDELLAYLSRTLPPERIAELSTRLKISLAP